MALNVVQYEEIVSLLRQVPSLTDQLEARSTGFSDDVDGHRGGGSGMVGHTDRRAGDGHVRVSDRLHLLEAVPVGDLVEPAEQLVQGIGELIRRRASSLLGRSDGVDEDHRHLLERLRDPPAGRDLELLDDDLRQDVQEQAFGSQALLVELTLPQEQRSRRRSIRCAARPPRNPNETR